MTHAISKKHLSMLAEHLATCIHAICSEDHLWPFENESSLHREFSKKVCDVLTRYNLDYEDIVDDFLIARVSANIRETLHQFMLDKCFTNTPTFLNATLIQVDRYVNKTFTAVLNRSLKAIQFHGVDSPELEFEFVSLFR